MPDFCHLHNHTQYSILDGAAAIPGIMAKAKKDGMKAVAITDHGNMFGVFKFFSEAKKNDIKPILGCEFYVAPDRFDKKDRTRHHQLLLAKNATGYKNLIKLCSLGYFEGYYYFPRIDRELIKKYSEGLIATTCCIAAQVPRTILDKGEAEGEKVFKEWLDIFGADYYIELQRHGLPEQNKVNEILVKWSKKYNVKIIATNDSHYVDQTDAEAHDILLCLQTGKDLSDENRFKFDNDNFYFKTKAEMAELFRDLPEALDNTLDIVSKVETLELKRDILLPVYKLPEGFISENDYLKHLVYQGAKNRYSEVSSDLQNRLDYELKVIADMGFPGYFLIVQDFIAAARKLDVKVGPGRGSAAGSAVAFCTGITNIDPVKYNLLFERFLNPERISMPDIDIDFDDVGRQKVIDYVIDKYGKNQVAQIVTFGSMAAKSSIRDVARVLQLPLPEADKLAKLVPDGPGVTLERAFKEVKELADYKKSPNPLISKTLKFAEILEGSVRHTGIHAAGVIIAPSDLTDHIPMCTAKDADLYVTQFDGKYIEDAGMLKMDFLGLKTLSIINDAIEIIKNNHQVEIDIDQIPLDDQKTYELFQRGETIGIFQFESEGMRMYLKDLKPTDIEDLIAMNALYRPGPMDYIPEFIDRKHGRKKVEYLHEWMEEMLKPTYGIMVYQEQIMQAAQIMAGYTLGAADLLRRAMGKKKVEEMQKQKEIFVKGAEGKGVDKKKAEEIFSVMEKFAQYGFNRSHSAAYSVLAYQTAYLKAHYPAEYLSAVLTHNMSDIKQVNFFLNESNKLGIKTLGPDINESRVKFAVNKNGEIRFALSAIKGVGEAAVEAIVKERTENGPFTSIFDLMKRVNLRTVNKKSLESLVQAGAFDSFPNIHRAQYFHVTPSEQINVIEKAIKYGNAFQQNANSAQQSLFGETAMAELQEPVMPDCEPWNLVETLQKEKDMTGIYLSGHPLDNYKLEIENFCSCKLSDIEKYKNRELSIGGIVKSAVHRISKRGNKFGILTLEDYTGEFEIFLFGEQYLKYKHFIEVGELLFLRGKYQFNERMGKNEFSVTSMDQLSNVKEKETKKITLNLPLDNLSDDLLNEIEQVCIKNPGKLLLDLQVYDHAEKLSVNMSASKIKVGLNEEFLEFFQRHKQLSYKLN